MIHSKTNNRGFTVVELLIATAVFSLVLIIFLTALIRISQTFYKGVSLSNTQEATRNAVQTISDDIQFYQEGPDLTNLNNGFFCVGDHRYAFIKNEQVDSDPAHFGLVREVNLSGCPPLIGPGSVSVDPLTAERLIDQGMQLNNLVIKKLNPGTKNDSAYNIQLMIVYYGSDKGVFFSPTATSNDPNNAAYDAYQKPDAKCTGLPSSAQLCATTNYQTTILQKF